MYIYLIHTFYMYKYIQNPKKEGNKYIQDVPKKGNLKSTQIR